MATSFNLQEYILFRTEIKRELTNTEVDTNFKMVANPWEDDRLYEIGNIVYHPVIVDDPATTGEDQVLAWWRANTRTTQGVFNTAQWDMIGGIGSGSINIQGANGFGKIKVNSTSATGALQAGNDALISSTTPNDTFNFIAGAGMQLQYNLTSKTIKLINTLASNPGEVNVGENIGLGIGHQDVYSGKVGVNLQFRGFQSTNTTNAAGNALTISTNSTQKNIEYNFNEGNVNLNALNSGAPLITMLSDVSTNAPNPQDILQWNDSASLWTPIAIGSLGQVNLYTNNGSIATATRTVSLNSSVGQLQFNRVGDTGTGIHFDNTLATHQLQLLNSASNGVAATQYALNAVTKATAGIFGGAASEDSFGINIGTGGLGGLTVDAFSISNNGELYVPQIAGDALITAGEGFRIPLVEFTGGTAVGKFASTAKYIAGIYTAQDGTTGQVQLEHEGRINLQSKNDTTSANPFVSLNVNSIQDFSGVLEDGFGIQSLYSAASGSILGAAYLNWMDKNDLRYIGEHFSTSANFDGTATGVNPKRIIGSNISLDNKATSNLVINVGELISFTGTGTNPQRVGLYSNVVDTRTTNNGDASLTELINNSGTWAGYFVGCVNIDKGGLVLPSTSFANRPLCNDVSGGTVSDRTLWINSTNGHLYRGTVDVEAGGGGGSLATLSDVTLTGLADDQLLVYNSTSGVWENAALAAYNLNAVSLTSGGVSIQLSDGVASSDVDLLPGTNITFSVDEATDEITINSSGGGSSIAVSDEGTQLTAGVTSFNFVGAGVTASNTGNAVIVTIPRSGDIGATGFTGATGVGEIGASGSTGAIGSTGFQGSTGAIGQQGASGSTGAAGEIGASGSQGITGSTGFGLIGATGVGATGFTGATGNIGATGNQGNIGATGNQGNIGATGAIGTQGSTGATGISGSGGATGSQGAAGLQGATGGQGITGSTGTQGVRGETGGQGATGDKGDLGAVGQQGATGGQGITGATGAIGLQGATGAIGLQGATGTQGLEGATGNQGLQGSTGAIGLQGATGTQGLEGATGTQGLQGAAGQQGATGGQGAAGTDGATGATGTDGATGAAGLGGGCSNALFIAPFGNAANGQFTANATSSNTLAAIKTLASSPLGVLLTGVAVGAVLTIDDFANPTPVGIASYTVSSTNTAAGQITLSLSNFSGATFTLISAPSTKYIICVSGNPGSVGSQGATGFIGATGTQGSTGAIGLQGATGTQGLQGSTGAIGLQGATGGQGVIGSTGSQGATGAVGQQGATGGQGAFGIQGASGAAGIQGGSGTGFIGATGGFGARVGIPWTSSVATTTPVTGRFYYDASTTTMYINKTDQIGFDQTVWINTWNDSGSASTGFGSLILTAGVNTQILSGRITNLSLTGNVYAIQFNPEFVYTANWGQGIGFVLQFTAYGSIGATGIGGTGFIGATGTQGANGAQGFIGATGTQGANGAQGAIGTQGASGATGFQGASGATGSQGSTGVGKQGLQGATGSGGAGGSEKLLFVGNRISRSFLPEHTSAAGPYSFGSDFGGGLGALPGFGDNPGLVIQLAGQIKTELMTAGYRVNKNYEIGDRLYVRGVLYFERTNSTLITTVSALQTTIGVVNTQSPGKWDPTVGGLPIAAFPGSNNLKSHVVLTGPDGSTCIFEQEIICDAASTVQIGDLLYFGYSVQNLSGEPNYFASLSSMTFQVYSA